MPYEYQDYLEAIPKCTSSTCPIFIREGTPSGLSMTSTGVPSGRKGISSSGKNTGNNPFVTVTSGHFIPYGDFTFLNDISTNELVNAWWQFIAIFTVKHFNIKNNPTCTMRYTKGCITNFTCFFTKDCM